MKFAVFAFMSCFVMQFVEAQNIGIGTNTPNPSAALEISSNNKGLLIPRSTIGGILAIANPAKGLLVLDTLQNQLMVNMGTAASPNWQTIVIASGWSLTGNNATNPNIHFIGTTDESPLKFRIKNVNAGQLDTLLYNSSFGFRSLDSNTAGIHNAAFGYKALISNNTGLYNVAIGSNAMRLNTSGYRNTAVGFQSMYTDTSGYDNTATGVYSLFANLSGAANVANGFAALYNNTTGYSNTASGAYSLFNNTIGYYNTALGLNALQANTTGLNNSSAGVAAMFNNTTGSANVAFGVAALFRNTDRNNLVAIGDSALYNNGLGASSVAEATGNTAIGSKSLFANTTGSDNTATGRLSLNKNTTGGNNTATGSQALNSNTTGYLNTAVGVGALLNNTAGFANTAIGTSALDNNVSGYYNTAIGFNAGVVSGTLFNTVALGFNAKATASNTIQLGDANVTTINTFGNVTVRNGKGMIRSSDGTQQKKVTAIVTVATTIAATGTYNVAFLFPEAFSAAPDVFVGNITGGPGGFAEVVMTIAGVTASGATLFVHNPLSISRSPNFTVKIIAIGAQ